MEKLQALLYYGVLSILNFQFAHVNDGWMGALGTYAGVACMVVFVLIYLFENADDH